MNQDKIYALLQGSYDLHIHPAPSHFPRLMDDFQLLEDASAHGMAGIMLKSHYECTAGRAAMANLHLSDLTTRAYGSVTLNWPVGGLNPYAAESALRLGGSFVWMPTRDAANSLTYGDMPGDFFSRPGIRITDETGALLPVIYDIFDVVKKYDATLGTGHISTQESIALCTAGVKAGVRMSLTHPEWERTIVPVEVQVELAHQGVLLEKCWANVAEGTVTAAEMASHIKLVGADSCFLTTDRGQAGLEPPVQGYAKFIQALCEHGIGIDELSIMMRDIPARMLAQ